MKKIIIIAIIGTLGIATPVYAQTQNDKNIKADVQALDKDNKALSEKRDNLSRDRTAKAVDKVNDDNGKQAIDSMKIGVDKTGIAEKNTEKTVDEKILKDDKEKMNQYDAGKQ